MSLDAEGLRIIAARNGVQLGATKPSAEDQQLLARMRTNRQARAVLGVVAKYLRRGYEIAQTVPSFISPIDGTKMAAEAMRSALDGVNRWAQKVYATIPDDDAPVSPSNRKKVTLALTQARSTLQTVSSAAEDLDRGLLGEIADLLLGKVLPDVKTRDLVFKIGIGVAALVGLFIAGKLIHTIVLGRSQLGTLGEAESAAVALMDAQRRRRRVTHRGS